MGTADCVFSTLYCSRETSKYLTQNYISKTLSKFVSSYFLLPKDIFFCPNTTISLLFSNDAVFILLQCSSNVVEACLQDCSIVVRSERSRAFICSAVSLVLVI